MMLQHDRQSLHAIRSLIFVLFAVTACGRAKTSGGADSAATASPAAAVASSSAMPLHEALGHHAENAYDQVKMADWTAARASVDSLAGAFAHVQEQDTANEGSEIRVAIQSLDSAVTRRDRMQALRDANTLTRLATLLPAARTATIPADVTALDFYGRELEIWSDAADTAKLRETSAGIQATWKELRPRVVMLDGKAEAARFDSAVAAVAKARTPAQYGRAAKPILDEVDALEAVFAK